MALFSYQARRLTGHLVVGEASAPTREALAAQLSDEGLVLVSSRSVGRGASGGLTGHRRQVRLPALLAFLRDFATLSRSGLPLAVVLRKLEERPANAVLGAAAASLRKAVETGQPLDAALADLPGVFPPIVPATVKAGMLSGRLDAAIDHLTGYLAQQAALDRKVRKASTYPLFLLAILAAVVAALMLFVLPRFADLYSEFDSALPWPTQVLMTMAEAAPVGVPVLLAACLGLMGLWRLWLARPAGRHSADRLRLALPLFGRVALDRARTQVAVLLSLLLSSGTALRPALGVVAEASPNSEIRARITRARDAVSNGRPLAEAVEEEGVFDGIAVSLIAAGELAGDLETSFDHVARHHQARLEDRLERALALIEPAMMLLVGLVLGGVVVAVYLPIFGLSGVVQ